MFYHSPTHHSPLTTHSCSKETSMLAIPVVEAVEEPAVAINDRSALGLTELLLKNSRKVDALVRDEAWQGDLIPRFLGIAVTSFSVFSVALAIVLSLVPVDYLP